MRESPWANEKAFFRWTREKTRMSNLLRRNTHNMCWCYWILGI